MEYCIYGTVFNNVSTIEESIKSFWRPDAVIVITDNFSTDGTWEKLQELRKEYNLVLYRYKSNRGQGRNYSLRHCPENSFTTYVDLDTRYNEAFHKLLEWAPKDKITHTYAFFGIKKEEFLKRGGWGELNVNEDVETFARVGFDYFIPVIIKENLFKGEKREKRYSKGLNYYIRRFNNIIDGIRGNGFYWKEISVYYKEKKYLVLPFYLIARMKGIYRHGGEVDNKILIVRNELEKIIDPKEIGIDDSYFLFGVSNYEYEMIRNVDEIIKRKFSGLRKFLCKDRIIRFVKSEEGLKKALLASNLKNAVCKEMQS